MPERQRTPIPGSDKKPMTTGRRVGPLPENEIIEASLYVRRRAPLPKAGTVRLSHEELVERHGADPADIAKVTAYAQAHGLTVQSTDIARRLVKLRGPASAFRAAFEAELEQVETDQGTHRCRAGVLTVGSELDGIVTALLGLDNRPQAQAHRQHKPKPTAPATPAGFTGQQVGQFYGFPSGDGSGQCIALIELGGGFKTADLETYFKPLGTVPKVIAVGVDNATNKPVGNPNSDDGEVVLDIEVAGAAAPGAMIAAYFAPNTDAGFVDAISQALHDTTNKPSVISISWGSAESQWTQQAINAMDQAFQSAAALGITVTVASGDSGSGDSVSDGKAHVDFPASSPHVLACGGTKLQVSGTSISSETVWNEPTGGATGGGVSDVFDVPSWQSDARVPPSVNPGGRVGRGVPDVSGVADPATGYRILVDGQQGVFGGTSSVAPLWAGLIAILNQQLGQRVGFMNPTLYANQNALRDITQGNNASSGVPGYTAGPGWDGCTGLGSPNGTALLAAFKAMAPAS
ncbi:MAG TPA: S53 family peptidase [Aliidongia sp.]|nr:S53 family peptidase [Aliidongia sp.]